MGGGKNYYSTDNVTDIKIGSASGKVNIQWTDPQDTTLDAIVFAAWAGTLVVRKEGSAPTNEKDGIVVTDSKVRDQYKNAPLVDTDVVVGKTYYYGIFPYTDQGVYNNSGENVGTVLVVSISPVFSEASWDDIISACQEKDIPDTWNVGDEKELVLTGAYAQTVVMQIWGKDLDDYADGSGKAPLTFGMKGVTLQAIRMHSSNNIGGWHTSELRRNTLPAIQECFPENVKNAVREITVRYCGMNDTGTVSDKLWVPSAENVGQSAWRATNCPHYPIFTDNASRVKTQYPMYWWLRDIYAYQSSNFLTIQSSGSTYSLAANFSNVNVCFGFCL